VRVTGLRSNDLNNSTCERFVALPTTLMVGQRPLQW
jgi:hypothetical protein